VISFRGDGRLRETCIELHRSPRFTFERGRKRCTPTRDVPLRAYSSWGVPERAPSRLDAYPRGAPNSRTYQQRAAHPEGRGRTELHKSTHERGVQKQRGPYPEGKRPHQLLETTLYYLQRKVVVLQALATRVPAPPVDLTQHLPAAALVLSYTMSLVTQLPVAVVPPPFM
jgi:hypothetical protein